MAALSAAPVAEAEKMVNGVQSGIACFFGVSSADDVLVNAEQDDPKLTAAHASLPFGSRVRVTNLANGRSASVIVTDRIPSEGDRIISVSRRAAERLGFVNAGTTRVKLELLQEASRM
jgi:rare lipoprotein A